MNAPVRIGVFDDHPLLREGVVQTLKSQTDFCVVCEGASADEAIRMADEEQPDILLLDVSMPGGGLAAAHTVHLRRPGIKAVILTVSEREEDLAAAMAAGVTGYVLKGVGGSELTRIIRAIAQGETYVSPGLAARLLAAMHQRKSQRPQPDRKVDLTMREEQVLDQAALGMTNKEIALQLDLSEKTIKHYMTSVLQKLHARNRVEAIIEARRRGLAKANG